MTTTTGPARKKNASRDGNRRAFSAATAVRASFSTTDTAMRVPVAQPPPFHESSAVRVPFVQSNCCAHAVCAWRFVAAAVSEVE